MVEFESSSENEQALWVNPWKWLKKGFRLTSDKTEQESGDGAAAGAGASNTNNDNHDLDDIHFDESFKIENPAVKCFQARFPRYVLQMQAN